MQIKDFLSHDCIIATLRAGTKKQVLTDLSHCASQESGLDQNQILEALMQRERLSSTGVGDGIALPHGKNKNLSKLIGVFARLEKPIDFQAVDGLPVDLVFLLLAPETAGADHLKALACIARVMRDQNNVNLIRQTRDQEAIYALLTREDTAHAA